MQEFAFQTAKRKAYLSSENLQGLAIDDFIRKTGKRKHTLLLNALGSCRNGSVSSQTSTPSFIKNT